MIPQLNLIVIYPIPIFIGKEVTLSNRVYKTAPLVVYASGPSGKQELRTIADYIPKAWNQEDGCISCWDDMISLGQKKVLHLTRSHALMYF